MVEYDPGEATENGSAVVFFYCLSLSQVQKFILDHHFLNQSQGSNLREFSLSQSLDCIHSFSKYLITSLCVPSSDEARHAACSQRACNLPKKIDINKVSTNVMKITQKKFKVWSVGSQKTLLRKIYVRWDLNEIR